MQGFCKIAYYYKISMENNSYFLTFALKNFQKMKESETKVLHLPILVEQDEDNFYIVSCPVFRGCHSYGATIDEALSNIKEVIDICMEEEKEKAPQINRFIGFREIQVAIKTAAV